MTNWASVVSLAPRLASKFPDRRRHGRWLFFRRGVTTLLKNEEPRVGEGRGQPLRAFQRYDAIVTTAHDEDGKLHPGEIQRRAGSAGHAGGESEVSFL